MALNFPDIDPVALSLGPLEIRWYALAYLVGFLGGWWYAKKLVSLGPEGARPNKDDIDNFIPWAVFGVILGGRIGYVLFYQAGMYLADPLEILKVWHGGMSFHGGALGVIIALFAFSARHKIPLLRLTDVVCACVPIGLFFGRIANFVNGELYGRASDAAWAVVFPRGGGVARHPSQLYEAFLEGLVLFAVLAFLMLSKKWRAHTGVVTGVFLGGYGFARFLVEFVREPDFHLGLFFFQSVSMGQILSVPMILAGVYIALRRSRGQSVFGIQ